MIIRPACDDDLAAVTACAEAAYAMYVARIGKKPAPMIADFAAEIDQGLVFVALDHDEPLLGFVVCYARCR